MAERRAAAASAESDERVRALAAVLVQDAGRFERALQGLAGSVASLEIPISGASMGASVPDGTVARVSLAGGPSSCAVGDIVVFRHGDQLVAHRVAYRGRYGRAAGHFITRGDARLAPDAPVAFGHVLGRVTALAGSSDSAVRRRSARIQGAADFARASLLLATALALHVSPSLARRLTQLFTAAERRGFPASLWRRVKASLGRAPTGP